jgi:hypothetical protein
MAFNVTGFPIVFVSSDAKLVKMVVRNTIVTPLKELIVTTDHIHMGSDTIYFLVKLDHILLGWLLSTNHIPHHVYEVSNQQMGTIISNVVRFDEIQKALFVNHVNIAMFHLLFTYYNSTFKEYSNQVMQPLPVNVQAHEQTQMNELMSDASSDLITNFIDDDDFTMDIDELLRELDDPNSSEEDAIDVLLREFDESMQTMEFDT